MKHTNGTDTLKNNLNTVAEKSAEMAKTFVESSAKQFEASLTAGKAIFDTITKQFPKTTDKQAEEVKNRFEDTYNTTTQWFEESSKIMTNLYDKQFRFMLDSYSNLMDLAFESYKTNSETELGSASFQNRVSLFLKNIEESSSIMKKMFANIIDNISNEADKGYIKEISELMQETYSNQTQQLLKFNKNLLDAANLQSVIKLNKEISVKLEKDLEKNFEASKKIIKSISDSYTKENGFSTRTGKKMLDEIFAEIDVVTKNNMKFWNNWFEEVYTENKTATSKTGKTMKNGQHA
jgi:hypothetical protein